MRAMIFALLSMFTLTSTRAADELTGTSPDGQFAFHQGRESIQLVALPSREVVIPDLFPRVAIGEPTIVWSKDSSRVAFCTGDSSRVLPCSGNARFSMCAAFQRRNGSFTKLTLPELKPPISIQVTSQHDNPQEWKDDKLVMVTDGLDSGGGGYSYYYIIDFDQGGKGKVASVQKTAAQVNSMLKAGGEVGWLIRGSVSADGELAVLFTARVKGAPPADFPYLVSGVVPNDTDATQDFHHPDGVADQMVTENVVVSLKEKRVLGRLELKDPWYVYFPSRNHHSFGVLWSPANEDGRVGILDFQLRFTSGAVLVVYLVEILLMVFTGNRSPPIAAERGACTAYRFGNETNSFHRQKPLAVPIKLKF